MLPKFKLGLLMLLPCLVSATSNADPVADPVTEACFQKGEGLRHAVYRLESRRFSQIDPLSPEEKSCAFRLSFLEYEQEQSARQVEAQGDARVWREVDEYMRFNFDSINWIESRLLMGRPEYDREKIHQQIRGALYFTAANGGLNPQGGDFLTTVIFLLSGSAREENPVVRTLFNDPTQDSSTRVGMVAAAAWLGSFADLEVQKYLPQALAKAAHGLFTALELVAIGVNNHYNLAYGLPLVGYKVLTARVNTTSSISFYLQPNFQGDFFGGRVRPQRPGVGLQFTKKF